MVTLAERPEGKHNLYYVTRRESGTCSVAGESKSQGNTGGAKGEVAKMKGWGGGRIQNERAPNLEYNCKRKAREKKPGLTLQNGGRGNADSPMTNGQGFFRSHSPERRRRQPLHSKKDSGNSRYIPEGSFEIGKRKKNQATSWGTTLARQQRGGGT